MLDQNHSCWMGTEHGGALVGAQLRSTPGHRLRMRKVIFFCHYSIPHFAVRAAWKTDSDSDALCVSSYDPASNLALCLKIVDPHMIPIRKIAKSMVALAP